MIKEVTMKLTKQEKIKFILKLNEHIDVSILEDNIEKILENLNEDYLDALLEETLKLFIDDK